MNLRIGDTSWINNNEETETKASKGVIRAQDLNITNQDDALLQKKKKAGQDAMDVIKNVFDRQSADDDEIAARHDSIAAQKAKKLEAVTQLNEFTDAKEGLVDKYGLTDEELAQINAVKNGEGDAAALSEAQKNYIEEADMYDAGISRFNEEIKACDSQIGQDQGTIKGIHDARLKEHDMVNANKAADAINEQASKEFVNGMIQKAVDEIEAKEDEAEKTEEEKKAEETEEEEKEKDKESNEEVKTGNSLSPDVNIDKMMEQVKKAVSDIAAQQNLTAEELKGIQVDEIL